MTQEVAAPNRDRKPAEIKPATMIYIVEATED